MIKKYVDRFMAKKAEVKAEIAKSAPIYDYEDIVRIVVKAISDGGYGDPDPEDIRELTFGDYQGTLVYVIPGGCDFWTMTVSYGSCSGCDTLQAIHDNGNDVDDYWTLALHLIQSMKEI